MRLIGYINLVWNEWGMLRCCQLQSSPLFTNSLRSIDAGLLRGNDNINQSWRHNGPNQPEITGNVTMSYVSVAVPTAARAPPAACLPDPPRRGEDPADSGHPTAISSSDSSSPPPPPPPPRRGTRPASRICQFLLLAVLRLFAPVSAAARSRSLRFRSGE